MGGVVGSCIRSLIVIMGIRCGHGRLMWFLDGGRWRSSSFVDGGARPLLGGVVVVIRSCHRLFMCYAASSPFVDGGRRRWPYRS